MSFAADVDAWVSKSDARMSLVLRKVTLDLLRRIVYKTPVDTGRARGNWGVSINDADLEEKDREDKHGDPTIALADSIVAQIQGGDTVFILNNVPYILELEYGWSDQAPQGMVRITAREYNSVFAAMAQETIQEMP